MQPEVQIGRVIRVGPGWADVSFERTTRRVSVQPGLLVRVGQRLQIINDRGVLPLPADQLHTTVRLL